MSKLGPLAARRTLAYNSCSLMRGERRPMWSSVEGLSRLFYGSQWAMAVLGGLTTLAIVFSIVVSVRRDKLVEERQEGAAAATRKTIQGQSDQVSGLKRQLSEAEKNLEEL